MTVNPKWTNALVNNLIETCHDGHRGYQAAAQQAGGMDLKRMFGKLALERKQFADELGRKIDRHVGTPHDHGTISGALHRGFIGLMGNVRTLSAADILRECVRGEAVAIKHYEDALEGDLPEDVMELAGRQLAHIAEARNRLVDLDSDAESEG